MALFGRGKRAFRLTGLIASPDGLYDGSFVVGCTRWWNHAVETRRDLERAGYRPLSSEDARRLCAVPLPENRPVLEAWASSVSLPGRHSAAVLALAYSFAVVIEAVAGQVLDDFPEAAWIQARRYTVDDLTELERHYSYEGSLREFDQWMPYWQFAQTLLPDPVAGKVIDSLKATFDDQVDRWSVAEGFDLRQSIGAPDYSMIAQDENAGLLNFVELLFEWGGRLRLGERLIAEGGDLRELRFGRDEFDPIDHFYDEAFSRYLDRAAETKPVSGAVEHAANLCTELLGDERTTQEQRVIFTTIVRAYLWRTVENGPVDFLEPELTDTVAKSRVVGEGRSPHEGFAITLFYAAMQCVDDGVKTRLGSIGGLIKGPRSYEKAFWDTTADYEENGLELDEETMRLAFQLGVCLADAERVLTSENQRA